MQNPGAGGQHTHCADGAPSPRGESADRDSRSMDSEAAGAGIVTSGIAYSSSETTHRMARGALSVGPACQPARSGHDCVGRRRTERVRAPSVDPSYSSARHQAEQPTGHPQTPALVSSPRASLAASVSRSVGFAASGATTAISGMSTPINPRPCTGRARLARGYVLAAPSDGDSRGCACSPTGHAKGPCIHRGPSHHARPRGLEPLTF